MTTLSGFSYHGARSPDFHGPMLTSRRTLLYDDGADARGMGSAKHETSGNEQLVFFQNPASLASPARLARLGRSMTLVAT